jgi:hypothetical protein
MIEIHTPVFEQVRDNGKRRLLLVDVVFARVVLECSAGNYELRVRDDFVATVCKVFDFLEVDFDFTIIQIWEGGRVVDEGGKLALTHLACAETKDEQERVDDV